MQAGLIGFDEPDTGLNALIILGYDKDAEILHRGLMEDFWNSPEAEQMVKDEISELRAEEEAYLKSRCIKNLVPKRRCMKHLVFKLKTRLGKLRLGVTYPIAYTEKIVGEAYGGRWSPRASNIINRARAWAKKDGVNVRYIRGIGYKRI